MDQVGIALCHIALAFSKIQPNGAWRLAKTIKHSIELKDLGLAIFVILLEPLRHFDVDRFISPK
jgi:hypothetical protein